MAPSGPAGPVATSRPPSHPPTPQHGAARLPTGFRWIAVRPGPPPPPRRPRRQLSPTPRYRSIPRWGLVDSIAPAAPARQHAAAGASDTAVHATLMASAAIFALAAGAHVLRYLLLLINRTTLLPPLVADGALLMGVLVSLAAIAAAIASIAVMTSWLIGRRARAFELQGHDDPRPAWALWAGCLTPVVNLVWAPVFVIELAHAERCHARLRGRITAWWFAWIFSTLLSAWAIWTSSATEPQAVADNTVTEILAYLAGLTALLLVWRVFDGFVRRPVQQRPTHRWVVVGTAPQGAPSSGETEPHPAGESAEKPDLVESRDPEPAA